MSADTARLQRALEGLARDGGTVIICRGCGGPHVERVRIDRLRCTACGAEGLVAEGFAIARVGRLSHDLEAAFAAPRGAAA